MLFRSYSSGLGRISTGTSDGLAFYNGGVATTELMRLDASGNLGLGVTPSATTTIRMLQTAGNGAFLTTNDSAYYGANAVYNSGWKYAVSSFKAALYAQEANIHKWSISTDSTQTAGNPITFTQDRKSTRLNSSHIPLSRMPSSA